VVSSEPPQYALSILRRAKKSILKLFFINSILLNNQIRQLIIKFALKDLRGQIERVAKFLDKKLTEEQLTRLTEHLRIANFVKNEAVNMENASRKGEFMNDEGSNKFIRKGYLFFKIDMIFYV
jgi:hypothetical protein